MLFGVPVLHVLFQAESKKERKSHTPASMSRTHLPPTATPEERASLEKLKQKMDFADDAVSAGFS